MKKVFILCVLLSCNAKAQINSTSFQQWKDLKYSMFIHFGIYSQLGGVWEGKPISKGLSEQIQAHAGIYSDVYAAVAKDFNPIRWNPDSIALLAKAAGMGSIVITSKHHDGFAMFNSAHTDFDVVEATPYKKDIVAELSAACKRHNLKFGLYFSLIDWHFPQASPISSHNSDFITPEHHQFNMRQIKELLTNYGTISELWFDMGSMSMEQSKEMRELVHKLQPDCMIGSRIGNDQGDFTVMGDNQEPDYVIGVPWQSPASFFDETWGYRSWQKRMDQEEKMREKLTSLIRVVSRGGNFLLNIGPRGDGSVVDYEKDVLLAMGKWLKKNDAAIYNTNPDPFQVNFPWGSVTSTTNKLNLLVMKNPENRVIELPGLKGDIKRAYILGEGTKCKTTKTSQGVSVQLPSSFDVSKEFKTIVLEFANGFTVSPINILKLGAKDVSLNHDNSFKYYSNSGIDYATRYTSTIKEAWTVQSVENALYSLELFYSEEERDKTIDLTFNGSTQTVHLKDDEKVSLSDSTISPVYGPLYLQGPFWSGIEGAHGITKDIDTSKPWNESVNKPWQAMPEWRNGSLYTLSAGIENAYYVLQEIESNESKKLIVKITSGDALTVWLNGEQKYIQINQLKRDSVTHFVLLDLKNGKNQLLVKLFNNFHKEIHFSIDFSIPQVIYRKKLSNVELKKDKLYSVDWKLHNPDTPHQDMNLPNMQLVLRIASAKLRGY